MWIVGFFSLGLDRLAFQDLDRLVSFLGLDRSLFKDVWIVGFSDIEGFF